MDTTLLKTFRCAQLIHDTLCAKTDYMDGGKICLCGYIVCIDDDATSAIYAAKLAKLHKQTYGFMPKILCVGGKGLMSRWTHKGSEGAFLANCCRKMDIPKNKLVVLDKGNDTGHNVLEIANYIKRHDAGNSTVLLALTKRLSLRYMLTMKQQAPEVNARCYVIEESVFEACKWYNGKRVGCGEVMLHELASVLNRCDRYAGTFQAPVPFKISAEVRYAADFLAKRYRLKLPKKNLRSAWQMVCLLADFLWHRRLMHFELLQTIKMERQRPL
uniref:Uncharacterized protein n=1 Tax=uncultured Alphaproteobacteria bacterium TaxID=91750 RepID=A0A6G8F3A6_9PROT|nr:hypothetical protein PlAlph_6080 [uncultured Alphaproteobacteria bacterium]